MKTTKFSKFKCNEISEHDSGYNENEWGFQKKKSISKTFVLYAVS